MSKVLTTESKDSVTISDVMNKVSNVEKELAKFKGTVDNLNSTAIRVNSVGDKVNSLETQINKMQQELTKPIINTLNILGTKLVEGIKFLETQQITTAKELKSYTKANEDKMITKLGISIGKKQITPFILLKLVAIVVIFLAFTNILTLCFIVFGK